MSQPEDSVVSAASSVQGAVDAPDFDEHRLGAYIRELRLKKGMSLRVLADEADVSVSFISQVERGTASPSIASLMRIARALDQTIGSLFETHQNNRLVRAGQGARLIHPTRQWEEEILTPRDYTRLEIVRSTLVAGGSSGPEPMSFVGPAEGSMIVQSGEVVFEQGAESWVLTEGDCLSYDLTSSHTITNRTTKPAVILFVSAPPLY